MASKKNLKKDINYLVDEVIGTCLMRQNLKNDKLQDELDNIIKDMLEFREEMVQKVNNPVLVEGEKNVKSYYRSLYSELLTKVNGVFDKLNTMTE